MSGTGLSFNSVSRDGHFMEVTIQGASSPKLGATKLHITGTIGVKYAGDLSSARTDVVSLVKGTPIKLGDLPAEISDIAPHPISYSGSELDVTFQTSRPQSAVKSIRFLAADSREIASHPSASSEGGGDYTQTYSLSEKVSKVIIEVTWWGKGQTVQIPIDMDVGVGI